MLSLLLKNILEKIPHNLRTEREDLDAAYTMLLGVVTPGRPPGFRTVLSPCFVRLGHSFVVFR